MQVLVISRGVGFGHAKRDYALADAIARLCRNARIVLASYGDGLTLLEHIVGSGTVLHMDADAESDSGTYYRAVEKIAELGADWCLVDEEYRALPILAGLGIPSVYVTNWLPAPNDPMYSVLDYSLGVVLAAEMGLFKIPTWMREKTLVSGPLVGKQDGDPEAGDRLGRPVRILVTFGSENLQNGPMLRAILSTIAKMGTTVGHVVMLGAGEHEGDFCLHGGTRVTKRPHAFPIDPYYRWADVIVARGGHTTLWEAISVGIPAVAIPRATANALELLYAESAAARGCAVVVPEEAVDEQLYTALHSVVDPAVSRLMRACCRMASKEIGRPEEVARWILACVSSKGETTVAYHHGELPKEDGAGEVRSPFQPGEAGLGA